MTKMHQRKIKVVCAIKDWDDGGQRPIAKKIGNARNQQVLRKDYERIFKDYWLYKELKSSCNFNAMV